MKKLVLIFFASVLTSFFLGPVGAQAPTKLTVYTNWFAEPGHGGYYAALKDGLYEARGLDVDLIQGGPQVNVAALLASGRADVAMFAGGQLLSARAEGLPLVALFATYQTSPQALMSHAENPVADFSDLAGRSVAVTPGATYWRYIEKKYGLEGKVQVLNYNGQLANWLLDDDAVTQSYTTAEPFFAAAEGARPVTLLAADSGFNPYTDVMATTESFLAEHPDAVKAFVEASRRGWEHFLASPTDYVDVLKAANDSITSEQVVWSTEQARPLIVPEGREVGSMTLERWEELYTQFVALGLIDKGALEVQSLLYHPLE